MNPAIWKKTVADAWRQLAISAVVLVLFSWMFVWLMRLLGIGGWVSLLGLIPDLLKPLLGVGVGKLASPTGQLSVLCVHPVPLIICVAWALGRGSDVVAGEIARGTMDLVLALPIWRSTVILASAVVTAAGSVVLAASVLAGLAIGLVLVDFAGDVSPWALLPGVVNLACMTFCFAGITTFVSSWNRDRWRTILLAGGIYVVSLILKQVWRAVPGDSWLKPWLLFASFLTPYEPQSLILEENAATLALVYDLILLGLGLLFYALGAVVLWRRDIPAAR